MRGCRVTVYNLDGRLYASATRAPAPASPPVDRVDCATWGSVFDVFAEDSPAKLRADQRACRVRVESGAIWLED